MTPKFRSESTISALQKLVLDIARHKDAITTTNNSYNSSSVTAYNFRSIDNGKNNNNNEHWLLTHFGSSESEWNTCCLYPYPE